VGGSTVCEILVRYAKQNHLSIVVPSNDKLKGSFEEVSKKRLPRPLGGRNGEDPMDEIMGMGRQVCMYLRTERERAWTGGLIREVETPLPSNHPRMRPGGAVTR
jgi:hypothetical protein